MPKSFKKIKHKLFIIIFSSVENYLFITPNHIAEN